MTHYLRFPDEQTAKDLLETAGLYAPETQTFKQADHDFALDVIGDIYETLGTYNPETGEELTSPVKLSGYHVNYIGTLPEEWQQYVVNPSNPYRVFAS
jgi:hypothetical protein